MFSLTLAKAAYNGVGISQYEAVCEMSNEAIRKPSHVCLMCALPWMKILHLMGDSSSIYVAPSAPSSSSSHACKHLDSQDHLPMRSPCIIIHLFH